MDQTVPVSAGVLLERGGCPFDPSEQLGRLRQARPLSRLVFPDGHEGWLVTGHDLVRRVLADTRFSSRLDLVAYHSTIDGPGMSSSEPFPAQPGMFINTDPPDHTRYRRMLTGVFTVRRTNLLAAHIAEIVERQADEMASRGPTLDLVEHFALPVPSLVICELLGVPYAEREVFQLNTAKGMRSDIDLDERIAAYGTVIELLADLVRRKRIEPGDDLLSDLVARDDLTDTELANIGMMLLGAGFETTANMLALGTFALLERPEQWRALHDDPELLPGAVEELMRYLSIADLGSRVTTEDIELDGQLIPRHSTVIVAVAVANRDPAKFGEPDTLDVRRDARGHLGFGHGVHQCLGQQLARIEMRAGYATLLRRFPTLRLAIPADDVPLRIGMQIFGVHELPVTW